MPRGVDFRSSPRSPSDGASCLGAFERTQQRSTSRTIGESHEQPKQEDNGGSECRACVLGELLDELV
eukprot:g4562.t1